MPNYRRLFIAGGTWFFTVNIQDRGGRLLVDHIDLLHQSIDFTNEKRPFDIDALVVLPNHLHAIFTPPPNDADFPGRWRSIKTHFAKRLPLTEPRSKTNIKRGERGIWQRRYWEHLIRDENDYDHHVDHCYFNPVRHGLVERVEDWPHSTFHRDMRGGFARTDWPIEFKGQFGERT